jgi:hypothetical protein
VEPTFFSQNCDAREKIYSLATAWRACSINHDLVFGATARACEMQHGVGGDRRTVCAFGALPLK